MNMEKKLRIIKIIDDNTIVGKGGTDENITKNSKFMIIGKNDGENIIDPESGDSLGFLGLEKGVVVADQVEEHFTVYKSQFIEEKNKYSNSVRKNIFLNNAFRDFVDTDEKVPAHYERLNVDLNEITGSSEATTIKVGDYLRQID